MTGDLTKQMRVVDQDYLDWIRGMQCIVGYRCQGAVVPHHLETRGAGGSDHFTLPLCGWHHSEIHMTGERTLGDRYVVDWWREVARLEERWWTKGGHNGNERKS
jgi:hypothetical protein